MRRLFILAILFTCSAAAQSTRPPSAPSSTRPTEPNCKKADTYALSCVVQVVQVALMNAQAELDKQKLPSLKTADLDFKAVVQKIEGVGISFWVFSIGATHEKDVTNDASFHWSKLPSRHIEALGQQVDLGKQLTDAVVAAARASQGQDKIQALDLTEFSVTVAYAVQNTITGGVSVPVPTLIALTPSLNGKFSKNNTQTVKLTFENR